MEKGFLKGLLRTDKTVYSFKELALLWQAAEFKTIKSRINYYVKRGDLYHIRRGLYATDKNYDRFELATKLCIPSYISFETVLRATGIIFQHYNQIFIASYQTKTINCDGQTYTIKRIKDSILTNTIGVELRENYSIATTERAFLDVIYLNKEYHFDNLGSLNWNKVFEILPIYQNKQMEKRVAKYYAAYKEEYDV